MSQASLAISKFPVKCLARAKTGQQVFALIQDANVIIFLLNIRVALSHLIENTCAEVGVTNEA